MESNGEVVAFSPGLLPVLTRLVNRHIAAVPPGWRLSGAQVADVLAREPWSVHYPEEQGSRVAETLCVAGPGGLAAAAQWAYPTDPALGKGDEGRRRAVLYWVMAEPDNPAGLERLLDTVHDRAREARCDSIASTRCAFGVGWFGLVQSWPHLVTGLQRVGYQRTRSWTILAAEMTALPARLPAPRAGLRLQWQEDGAAAEWTLAAYDGERLVGECQAWGIPPPFRDCPGFHEWVTVEWLGVEPAYRRQGISRTLLQEQLLAQAARGVKHVLVWTRTDNVGALKTVRSLGFGSGLKCWEVGLQLDTKAGKRSST